MNGDIYLKHCLKERLLPLIKKHQSPVVFWPDLASCHFAKNVKEWYEAEGLFVVPRECNPPNTPEIRPIETYWAIIKSNYYCAATVSKDDVQRLMAGIRSKVRRLVRGESLL